MFLFHIDREMEPNRHSAGAKSLPRLFGCDSVLTGGFLLASCWQNMGFLKRGFSIERGAYLMCGSRSWQKPMVHSSRRLRGAGTESCGLLSRVGAVPAHPEGASTAGDKQRVGYNLILSLPVPLSPCPPLPLSPSLPCQGDPTTPAKGQSHLES